jgi:hypothetical protein
MAYMADSGTASSVYIPAMVKGRILRIGIALQGQAVGTANNVFTAAIAKNTDYTTFTAITMDTLTQATSGSTAGDVDWVNCSSNNYVEVGDSIRITSDGGGSNTTPTMVAVLIAAE